MKIQISRMTWLILGIGAFILWIALMGIKFMKDGEQSELNRQITSVQQLIAKIPINELTAKDTNLKSQLPKIYENIAAVKLSLTGQIYAIEVVNTLYDLADAAGIEIYEVKSAAIASQIQGKTPFDSLSLTVGTRGAIPGTLAFTKSITDTFPTGIIKSVDIKIPAENSLSSPAQALPTESITLNILSYKEKLNG